MVGGCGPVPIYIELPIPGRATVDGLPNGGTRPHPLGGFSKYLYSKTAGARSVHGRAVRPPILVRGPGTTGSDRVDRARRAPPGRSSPPSALAALPPPPRPV